MSKTLSLLDYPKKDIAKALKQCDAVLKEDSAPLPSLHPECLITILVPVYDESVARIKEQVAAFAAQNFPKNHFEMVLVVNNPKAKNTSPETLKNNALAITYLKRKNKKIIAHVIDRSSKGHELKIGNVGEARNFGIHLVAKRYLDQKRDGIIIQLDADTIPPNANYLKTVLKDFLAEKAFAAAGGVKFVLSLDSKNAKERAFFKKHLPAVRDFMHWNFYLFALQSPEENLVIRVQPNTFSGAHMISRAVASICAGGIRPIGSAEDVFFGRALTAYAEKNHGTILARRDKWIVKTSLRESARTGSSFGPVFENIRKHGDHPLVRSADSPHYLTFLQQQLEKLQKAKLDSKKTPTEFLGYRIAISKQEYKALIAFWETIKKAKTNEKRMAIYEKARQSNRAAIIHTFFNRLYRHAHPQVPLTKKALQQLKAAVNKSPIRKANAENKIKYFATFHLN